MELNTERLLLRTVTEVDIVIIRDFGKDEFKTDEDALKWVRWVKRKNDEGRLIVIFYIWLIKKINASVAYISITSLN